MGKIAIFITAAILATTPAIASLNVNGQRDISEPWFCDSKLLMDLPRANNLGWNPDGNATYFTIQDDCYVEIDSIVLLNVVDGGSNFEACNVDYTPSDGAFEVYCSSPPAEGSELHYTILVDDKEVIAEEIEETLAEIPGRQQNSTQQ